MGSGMLLNSWMFAQPPALPWAQGIGGPLHSTQGEGISAWVESKLGFVPDAPQRRVLETRSEQVLLNCTRQWGKCAFGGAKVGLAPARVSSTAGEAARLPAGVAAGSFVEEPVRRGG